MSTIPAPKLPRAVEADPHFADLEELLARDQKPIWEKGTKTFSHIPFLPGLESALGMVLRFKQLVIGLEKIEKVLESEKKGLDALHAKQGTPPSQRISRLLIVANDGSERFYRSCESLAHKHGDRLLLLVTDVPSERLAEKIFGPGREIKALLVSDRDATSKVLLSLLTGQ